MSRGPVIICAECGRERPHKSRGVCVTCYWRHYRAGTLDALRPPRKPRSDYWRVNYDADDVDPAVVERVLSGEWRLRTNASERTEVCRRWVASGRSLSSLEKLTGWATHRYYRIRDDHEAEAS